MSTARTLTPDTRAVEELIVERARLSYARLPMLEVVFDRFSLSLAQTLKSYLGAMADVSLDGIDYLSCQDALKDQPDPSLISVTTVPEWNGTIAAIMTPELLFGIIEITFGGRTVATGEKKTRNFTSIEKRIGENFVAAVQRDLANAFAKVTPVTFEISHLETNPKALLLAPPASACVRAD